MKYIWLGIKDYSKDCWHDWLIQRIKKVYGSKDLMFYNDYAEVYMYIIDWKEGNLWYYIQQRRIAHKKHFADASKKIKERK